MGGHASKVAREEIEKNLGKTIVTKSNNLSYQYIGDNDKIEHK